MNGLPDPVSAELDAANRGDERSFLDRFTPDGVVDDWGREFKGRAQIHKWSAREFIGVNVTLDVVGVDSEGAVTTVTANVGGDGFNGPSHFTFVVAGDRIARMTIRA
jgi:hypothetical protein